MENTYIEHVYLCCLHENVAKRNYNSYICLHEWGKKETKVINKRKKKQYEEHKLEQLEERFKVMNCINSMKVCTKFGVSTAKISL